MTGLVALSAEARVKICCISYCNYARIELLLFALFLAEESAVFVVDISVEFEFAVRSIRYCNGNNAVVIKGIVEIVSSVRSDRYVRSIEASSVVGICGIIRSLEDNALILPVTEIVDRS